MATKMMVWAHCNSCARKTKHDVVAQRISNHSAHMEDGFEIEWTHTHRIIECRGCEAVSFHLSWWHSEYDVSEDVTLYPPRISRAMPGWSDQLPDDIGELMKEIYSALHADSRRLAMMGARACVDMYMNETIGDVGGFAEKLRALVESGHLSKIDDGILGAALEVGHAASHRGHCPSSKEVNQVMDIVENLLQKLALSKSAELLSKSTPQRIRKPKTRATKP